MRLLVVDDEPLICHGLCRMLGELNFVTEIRNAASGPEALELMRDYSPDLVFTDIRMPGMDGLSFIRLARAEFSCSQFYVLTNYAHFQYAKVAIELGVRGYLLKPVERDELFNAVRQARDMLQKETREPSDIVTELLQSEPSLAQALVKLMLLALTEYDVRDEILRRTAMLEPTDAAACALRETLLKIEWAGKGSRSVQNLLLTILRDRTYRCPLTITAEKVGLNPGYVSTSMSQRLGISYSSFVNCLRVALAQHLLLTDEGMTVSAVCEQCGFENSNHFFRAFKQWTGDTPKEFRAKERLK